MSTTEHHREPLGQIPVDLNINLTSNEPIDLSSPLKPVQPNNFDSNHHINNGNVTSIDDLAASMAKVAILDEDEDDYENIQGKATTVDWKKQSKEMDKMFESQAAQQLQDLPPFEPPKAFKKSVKFFGHQVDGIRWLLKQEQNPLPNPFNRERKLKDGTVATYDKLSRARMARPHPTVKGSILADDMGLGKTVQTLALILSNPPEGYVWGKTDGADIDAPLATLIVCPKTVISNWETQIKDFVRPGKVNVVIYTGTPKQRSKIVERVEENEIDILISTYETIAAEYEKDRPGIKDAKFHRIVLDEAQQIRNSKSKQFKAIEEVSRNAEYRLALTGTPFVNKPEDIHSLLAFIGLKPLSDAGTFNAYITEPIKDRKRAGLTRLRAALIYVALRRTKAIVPNLKMADKTVQVCEVPFPEDSQHKDVHDVLYLAARSAFEASINGAGKEYTESEEGVTKHAQSAMFSLLLRVRQACADGRLVSAAHFQAADEVIRSMKDEDGCVRKLSARMGNEMLSHLQSTEKSDERLDVAGKGPKIEMLLHTIKQMQDDEKGVVFSQWTAYLDLIGDALREAGYKFTRIDGSMTTEARTQALEDLNHDDECRFILCSLKAAGVGINCTRANYCYMMDPWWNASIENQAIDRVHRLGQARPVHVFRFVMKNTIEERMLKVQEAKATLGKGTMTKLSAAEEKVAKVTSLKDLFEIQESQDSISDFIDNTDDWY